MINHLSPHSTRLLKSIVKFINNESFSGILLILATAVALIWVNSPFSESYHHLWEETLISISFGSFHLSEPLHYWINDGLMAVFFFVIGLEIKRELMVGELSSFKKASLPTFAALGGMIVPAFIFFMLNMNDADFARGWAIPMATDIAFALGIISLLGKRVPVSLKVFLAALAIVDDIGAVTSIAIFYTEDISFIYLGTAICGWLLLLIINYFGGRNNLIYGLIGVFLLWFPMLLSGVHATIAGVLAAIAIPARRKIPSVEFVHEIKSNTQYYEEHSKRNSYKLLNGEQLEAIESMKDALHEASTPLQNIEHHLQKFALYFIMPLFALANTGVEITAEIGKQLFGHPVSLGILLGLVMGKVMGISLFSYIAIKLKIASMPPDINIKHLIGAGLIAGIGFTMSLFITDLAFENNDINNMAKKAIFGASLISGLAGYFYLKHVLSKSSNESFQNNKIN